MRTAPPTRWIELSSSSIIATRDLRDDTEAGEDRGETGDENQRAKQAPLR
jgi:hypothetical protein